MRLVNDLALADWPPTSALRRGMSRDVFRAARRFRRGSDDPRRRRGVAATRSSPWAARAIPPSGTRHASSLTTSPRRWKPARGRDAPQKTLTLPPLRRSPPPGARSRTRRRPSVSCWAPGRGRARARSRPRRAARGFSARTRAGPRPRRPDIQRRPRRGPEARAGLNRFSAEYPRRGRGRDSSPRNIHVAAVASPRLVSTKYPRRGRGGDSSSRNIHATRLHRSVRP